LRKQALLICQWKPSNLTSDFLVEENEERNQAVASTFMIQTTGRKAVDETAK